MRNNSATLDVIVEVGKVKTILDCQCDNLACILSKCSSPDLVTMVCSMALEIILLILPDDQGSCHPSEISSIIRLLYFDQLQLHFCRTNAFGYFCSVQVQFKLIKYKFQN